jgi:hypothetical protein
MRSVTKTALTIVACLNLADCAPRVWLKDGATQADYNTDSYSCEKDVRQSTHFGEGIPGALNMREMYARCMQAHGWTEAAAGQPGFRTVTPP